MSEWIKCEDQLPLLAKGDPDLSDSVLVYQTYFGTSMIQAAYSYQDQDWYDSEGETLSGKISHWMPLPSPPEDSK